MRKFLLILLLGIGTSLGLQAQITYQPGTFTNTGNPGGLNTTTDAAGGWTSIMPGSQSANAWSQVVNIPFAFDFYGMPVTQLMASQNGVVTFDVATGILPGANEPLPSANLPDMSICAFWDEFTASPPTGSNDQIVIDTFGTAPNQQFWIKWFSFEMGNPTLSFVYAAVVLEETTNNIYVVDLYSTTAGSLSATVGVQLDATTAVEIGNSLTVAGNGSGNTDNDYFEFMPFVQQGLDVFVSGGSVDFNCSTVGNAAVTIDYTNQGTMDATGVTASFSVDGGAFTTPEVIPGTLTSGASNSYTFTATADLSAPGPHTVEVVAALVGETDVADNNATVNSNTEASLTAPFVEDFETGVSGTPGILPAGWVTTSTNAQNWYVEDDGATNSSGTGPLDDHTAGGSVYVYTEASGGANGDIYELISPCIDLGALAAPKLEFWYHMFGGDIGALVVEIEVAGVITELDSIVGQQQIAETDPWLADTLDLAAYAGQTVQLIFKGIRGDGFESDMAIDDVKVFEIVTDDLSVTSGSVDVDACNYGAATVNINITNNGTNPATNILALFAVDGGATIAPETIPGPLAPGASMMYTFTTTADISAVGPHTIEAGAGLIGEPDTTNNSVLLNVVNASLSAPSIEDFETGISGVPGTFPTGWTTTSTNSQGWYVEDDGATNSGGTGPLDDHTDGGSVYVYTEASGGATGDSMELISPCIDLSSTNLPRVLTGIICLVEILEP